MKNTLLKFVSTVLIILSLLMMVVVVYSMYTGHGLMFGLMVLASITSVIGVAIRL